MLWSIPLEVYYQYGNDTRSTMVRVVRQIGPLVAVVAHLFWCSYYVLLPYYYRIIHGTGSGILPLRST